MTSEYPNQQTTQEQSVGERIGGIQVERVVVRVATGARGRVEKLVSSWVARVRWDDGSVTEISTLNLSPA